MSLARGPRIVWPTPGLPAFVEGERRCVDLLVEHNGSIDDLRDWAAGLVLQEIGNGRRSELAISHIGPFAGSTPHPYARGYLRTRVRKRSLFEISAVVASDCEPQAPRSACVCDLLCDGAVVQPRAVAIWAQGKRSLRLAFATDLHVSHAWESIAAAVDRHAPDLRDVLCHPQRLLQTFIDECNELAARGLLDLVVLGGDLVDHVYRTANATSAAVSESNVQLLVDLLSSLSVPSVVIPGNHDYRVNPWRPRAFGLGSVGIPKARLRSFLEPAGLWQPWRLLPSDTSALRTVDADGSDGLLAHLSLLAPATDYAFDVRGVRLAFFATGRDMVLRWHALDWQRRALLARALPTTWVDPDSEGPNDEQIRWLRSALDGARNAAVFFHAPILSPQPDVGVEHQLSDIHPGENEDHATQVAFERRLQRSGLRGGTSFRNVGPLVRTLLSVPGAVTTFSGHVHCASRVEIERSSLRARSAPIASSRNGAGIIPLHIGASLGHVRHPGSGRPGYLLAEFEDGTLRSVQARTFES